MTIPARWKTQTDVRFPGLLNLSLMMSPSKVQWWLAPPGKLRMSWSCTLNVMVLYVNNLRSKGNGGFPNDVRPLPSEKTQRGRVGKPLLGVY